MLAILKRELRSYFQTSTAYIFLASLFIFFGLFFLMTNVLSRPGMGGEPSPVSGNFSLVFNSMQLVILFIIPILTMKLISEERRQKTDQLLHTVPLSTFEIVIAKFLSAFVVFTIGMIISLIYPALLYFLAGATLKTLWTTYLGFCLLGGAFIAIGVFSSSITESQFIASIVGFFIILGMWLMQFIGGFISTDIFTKILDLLSIVSRFGDFQSGVIKVASIFYYLSVMIIFLFFAVRVMDKRRWTEG